MLRGRLASDTAGCRSLVRLLECVSGTDAIWVKCSDWLSYVMCSSVSWSVGDRSDAGGDRIQKAGHTGRKSYLKVKCRRMSHR